MNAVILLAALLAATSLAAPEPDGSTAIVSATAMPTASRFSVTVEGRGPDIVLIPGLLSSRRIWDQAVAGLGGRFRFHRLQVAGFAGDPPAGNSEGPLLMPIVDALHAYIVTNRLQRPAIVGHSMGGLIGLMLAERYPDDAGKLLIVDALPFYPLVFGPGVTPEAIAPQAEMMRDSLLAMPPSTFEAQEKAMIASLARNEAARPALLADALASDRGVAARITFELMTTDVRPQLGAVRIPVTIAYATNDHAPLTRLGPLYADAYRGLAGARLVSVDQSYHFIMLDQPGRLAALLHGFLDAR